MGPQNVLHKYEPLLLNTPICMLLYLLACVIVTASSAVIYMYGYQKFMAFIQQEKEKQTIQLVEVSCHQAVTKQSPNCNLGQDLGVDVLPPHRRHVHPHRPRCVQRAPALRLHHHLQGLAQYLALDITSRWFFLNFLSTCNFFINLWGKLLSILPRAHWTARSWCSSSRLSSISSSGSSPGSSSLSR